MQAGHLSYKVEVGIPEGHRLAAAQLYDEAFGQKFMLAIPDAAKRIELFQKHFELKYALAAIMNSDLLGIAGFSTSAGSLTAGIDYGNLLSDLGVLGGHRAALVLSFYERQAVTGELLLDGISVSPASRGLGVGTRLLRGLIDYAATNGYDSIRLDVIDTNDGARKLYERLGFVSIKTEEFEILRGMLGFGAATTMVYDVKRGRLTK